MFTENFISTSLVKGEERVGIIKKEAWRASLYYYSLTDSMYSHLSYNS